MKGIFELRHCKVLALSFAEDKALEWPPFSVPPMCATRPMTCPKWLAADAPLLFSSLSQTDLIWSVDRDGAETMTVTAEFTARGRARQGGEAIADSGHVRPN